MPEQVVGVYYGVLVFLKPVELHSFVVSIQNGIPTRQRLLESHPTQHLLGFSAALAPKFPPGGIIIDSHLGFIQWICVGGGAI